MTNGIRTSILYTSKKQQSFCSFFSTKSGMIMSSVKVTFDLDLLIQEINHLKYLTKNVKIYFLRKEI